MKSQIIRRQYQMDIQKAGSLAKAMMHYFSPLAIWDAPGHLTNLAPNYGAGFGSRYNTQVRQAGDYLNAPFDVKDRIVWDEGKPCLSLNYTNSWSTTTPPVFNLDPRTMSCWVKDCSTTTKHCIFALNGDTTDRESWQVYIDDSHASRKFQINTDYYVGYTSRNIGAESAGTWLHIVCRKNTTSSNITDHTLFVNNKKASISTWPSNSMLNTTNTGSPRWCADNLNQKGFRGKIDDMMFWNRALTDAEVDRLYRLGRQGLLMQREQYAHIPASHLQDANAQRRILQMPGGA